MNLIDKRKERSKNKKTEKKIKDLLIKEILNLKLLVENLLRRKKKSKSSLNKKKKNMMSLLKRKEKDYSESKKTCLRDMREILRSKKIGTMNAKQDFNKMRRK